MDKGYKISKELGRSQPTPKEEEPIITEEIQGIEEKTIEYDSIIYWREGYEGPCRSVLFLKNPLQETIKQIENDTGKLVVGVVCVDKGTIQIMLGE